MATPKRRMGSQPAPGDHVRVMFGNREDTGPISRVGG